MYIYLEAYKRDLLNVANLNKVKWIHLKGHYGGQLLSIVSKDDDNSFHVIAYIIVSLENKDTWMWFLTKLLEGIRDPRIHG